MRSRVRSPELAMWHRAQNHSHSFLHSRCGTRPTHTMWPEPGRISQLRSDSAHCDQDHADEIPPCPVRSGPRRWDPAVPTEIRTTQMRSRSAHWDLELGVLDLEGWEEGGKEGGKEGGRRRPSHETSEIQFREWEHCSLLIFAFYTAASVYLPPNPIQAPNLRRRPLKFCAQKIIFIERTESGRVMMSIWAADFFCWRKPSFT